MLIEVFMPKELDCEARPAPVLRLGETINMLDIVTGMQLADSVITI